MRGQEEMAMMKRGVQALERIAKSLESLQTSAAAVVYDKLVDIEDALAAVSTNTGSIEENTRQR